MSAALRGKLLHLAGVKVEEAAGVQLAGESTTPLTVAGVVVLVPQSYDSASCSGGQPANDDA